MPATVVTDLTFGDAGKGAMVDWLCRNYEVDYVVRTNGGCQAGHNVQVPGTNTFHTFSSFGSGTFANVPTYLSRQTLVSPIHMVAEAAKLTLAGVNKPEDMMFIDPRCRIVTMFHECVNQLSELMRGDARHGSCGFGIGAAVEDYLTGDVLFAYDLDHKDHCERILRRIQERLIEKLRPAYEAWTPTDLGRRLWASMTDPHAAHDISVFYKEFASIYEIIRMDEWDTYIMPEHSLVFEGAQGVLLDEWYGFHPYTTWSTTTSENAWSVLREAGVDDITTLGLTRIYTTRHGAGPMPSEAGQNTWEHSEWMEGTGNDPFNRVKTGDFRFNHFGDHNNPVNEWQGKMRVGDLDTVLLRYAVEVNGGVDSLVVSHLDQWHSAGQLKIVSAYKLFGSVVENLAINPNKQDLEYQSKLTQMLSGVTDVVFSRERFTGKQYPGGMGEQSLVRCIEQAVGVPVSHVGHGPTQRSTAPHLGGTSFKPINLRAR